MTIFMPIFSIYLIAMQERKRKRRVKTIKIKKKKGALIMSIDAFKRHIGRRCQIITILDKKISGKINRVDENWVEVETSKRIELINIEFIERLSIITN